MSAVAFACFMAAQRLSDASTAAFNFEHMETNQFHQVIVRELIQKEYFVARSLLEMEAKSLAMEVRSVDLQKMRDWFHKKAFIYSRCYDVAITNSRTAASTNIGSEFQACVKATLRIADEYERRDFKTWDPQKERPASQPKKLVPQTALDRCEWEASVEFENFPKFDFLEAQDPTPSWSSVRVYDFHKLKRCVINTLF